MEDPEQDEDNDIERNEPLPPVPRDKLPPNARRDLRPPQVFEEEEEEGGYRSSGMNLKYIVAIAMTSSLLIIGFGWILMYQGELRVADAENNCLSESYGCDARDRSYRLSGLLIHNWGKSIVMFGTLLMTSAFLWMGLFFDRFPSNLRIALIIGAVVLIISLPLISLASPAFDMSHLYN